MFFSLEVFMIGFKITEETDYWMKSEEAKAYGLIDEILIRTV